MSFPTARHVEPIVPTAPLYHRSRIAALDPAQETTDMDATGECELIFLEIVLGNVLVFGPLRHEMLEARQIDQTARQAGGFESLDVAGDRLPCGIERAKPDWCLGPASAFVENFRRQPVS